MALTFDRDEFLELLEEFMPHSKSKSMYKRGSDWEQFTTKYNEKTESRKTVAQAKKQWADILAKAKKLSGAHKAAMAKSGSGRNAVKIDAISEKALRLDAMGAKLEGERYDSEKSKRPPKRDLSPEYPFDDKIDRAKRAAKASPGGASFLSDSEEIPAASDDERADDLLAQKLFKKKPKANKIFQPQEKFSHEFEQVEPEDASSVNAMNDVEEDQPISSGASTGVVSENDAIADQSDERATIEEHPLANCKWARKMVRQQSRQIHQKKLILMDLEIKIAKARLRRTRAQADRAEIHKKVDQQELECSVSVDQIREEQLKAAKLKVQTEAASLENEKMEGQIVRERLRKETGGNKPDIDK